MHHGILDASTAHGLQVLQERIARAGIPPSQLDENITIATWNVREFGRRPRKALALHYVAEIIGQFDLVSIVELRDDLSDLKQVLGYLGPYWKVVYTDFLTDAGGNRERMAFVYDERAVQFTGLASQASAPRKKNEAGDYLPEINWWRPPFIASFRAGSFDFILVTAHIRWGDKEADRTPELRLLAEWVARRQQEEHLQDKDIIVLGDFNIPSHESPLFKAITSKGLQVPRRLLTAPGTDLVKGKRYDQILHNPLFTTSFTDRGGVLDFYCGDHGPLFPEGGMTKSEFTYQVSDHLPLWIEVKTDVEGEVLDQLINR